MPLAHSRLTSQGQISVPADVRKKLGIGPGSILEWDEDGDKIVVRRAGRYTFGDIHHVLFPDGPPKKRSIADLKEGIREHIRRRHSRQ
jgi:antitoxin PrlF